MIDVISHNNGKESSSMSKVVKINQKYHAQCHICPDTALLLKLVPAGLKEKARR